jgi:hypothetical protein
MACQYPQEYKSYILVFVKDQLYFFDKDGNKKAKENFTSLFKDQPYYEIIPIKNNENNLYYIISFTIKTTPINIKFFYYKMNIDTKENFLIFEKEYIPLTIANANFNRITENAPCVLMNSDVQNNILTCFYSGNYPCQISITSFSLENENLTKLSSYSKDISFNAQDYLDLFRAKTNSDKSKAYIVFSSYENGGYSAIYNINLNELYSIEKRVEKNCLGASIRSLNLFYFERAEQFVIFFRDNDRTFRIVIMDKDYKAINNENGNITFKFTSDANFVQRESIIYLKDTENYFLLSGAILNGFSGIKAYSINITSNITNIYNEYEDEKEEEKKGKEVEKEEEKEEKGEE